VARRSKAASRWCSSGFRPHGRPFTVGLSVFSTKQVKTSDSELGPPFLLHAAVAVGDNGGFLGNPTFRRRLICTKLVVLPKSEGRVGCCGCCVVRSGEHASRFILSNSLHHQTNIEFAFVIIG
jgi:hypothetical protein